MEQIGAFWDRKQPKGKKGMQLMGLISGGWDGEPMEPLY
jgi:hypothetical protein